MTSYVTSLYTLDRDVKRGSISQMECDIKQTKTVYEAIYGSCVPYYDFDPKYDTEANRAANFKTDLKASYDAVCARFPGARVYILESTGYSNGKNCYTNSLHFVVRGAGYCSSGLAESIDSVDYATADLA